MTKETMTIHKALCELKILDSRIEKGIAETQCCYANKHSNSKVFGKNINDYTNEMKSKYESTKDLINRRKAIKKAVVLSNARTEITIDGNILTIAEAIEMKNNGITYEQKMINSMIHQFNNYTVICNKNNEELPEKCDKYIIGMFGEKENKQNNSEIDAARETYIEQNTYELIEICNVSKEVEKMQTKIDKFMSEVDSAISVSNALTTIDIEY